jgi:endosialidase-like protein
MDRQVFTFKTLVLLPVVACFAISPRTQAESPARVYRGYSTAAGDQALQSLTSGVWNTAIGTWALLSDTTGACNVAAGNNTLRFNTTGTDNTAVGVQALRENTSGTRNTALGYLAGINLITGSYNIDIGNPGSADESFTIRIGSPAQKRTFISAIREVTTASANAIPVLIDSYGQLGTASSSERFKKEIKPMEKASEAILSLRPVTFQYKNDDTATPQFGLIAEEVAKVNPDLVVRDNKGEVYSVRYDAVNGMLLNEFLKEHRKVEKQEASITQLRFKVAKQEQDFQSTIARQQSEIQALTAALKKQTAEIERVNARLETGNQTPRVAENR